VGGTGKFSLRIVDDALTAVADTRTGNYSDWLETDCESISPAFGSTWRPPASRALPAQSVMDAFDGAAGVPPREVPVHRRRQGEVLRLLPPGELDAHRVEDPERPEQ
jgi:hypothetical protein